MSMTSPPSSATTPSDDSATAGEESTDRRLLLTAERLFAERGIDAVSLRQITAEAGTNVASIHYHFGSRDALVAALIQTRAAEVSAQRSALLQALEEAEEFDARDLARAFVRPVADMVANGGASWVRLISSILATAHPTRETVINGFLDQGRRFNTLLRRLHPDWERAEAQFRLGQAMRLTFTVLGDTNTVQTFQSLDADVLDHEQLTSYLENLVTSILSTPPL